MLSPPQYDFHEKFTAPNTPVYDLRPFLYFYLFHSNNNHSYYGFDITFLQKHKIIIRNIKITTYKFKKRCPTNAASTWDHLQKASEADRQKLFHCRRWTAWVGAHYLCSTSCSLQTHVAPTFRNCRTIERSQSKKGKYRSNQRWQLIKSRNHKCWNRCLCIYNVAVRCYVGTDNVIVQEYEAFFNFNQNGFT